ncbi:MAG TPA: universal stress protein [Nitrospiraceae bacterium]|jgi:nucleotide-binding universal stress UspA family protein|nr:universal stress protein [Nitrospiraceae bacterium]
MHIKQILFPTDFSEGSAYVIPYVVDLTKHYQARLFIVHVVYDIAEATGFYVPHITIDELYDDIAKNARKECERWCAEELRGYKEIEYRILKGIPAVEILKFAEENKIDLIIMGTHSRRGLDRIIFGSTAEKVVRNSRCPVLTSGVPLQK